MIWLVRMLASPDAIPLAVVVLVATAARGAVYLASPLTPPVFDMAEYWMRAEYLYAHGALYPDSGRMPGLPATLAAVFAVAGGPSMAAARVMNIVAGAITAGLTYLLARRAVDRRAAAGAALAVALYPSLLVYTCLVTTETLVMVPLVAALLAASYGTPRAAVLAGVCAGLATLVRPAGVAILPAVLAAALWPALPRGPCRRRALMAALTVAGFVLAMSPWWLHGIRLHGQFVPLDTTSGLNVVIGNGPHATGRYRYASVARQTTEFLAGLDTTTPDGSNQATARAVAYARAHPGETAALVPAKLGFLLALEGNEQAYLYSISHFGERRPLTVWLWGVAVLAAFPLLLTAGLLGLVPRHERLSRLRVPAVCFLGTAVALSLVSFGEPRFHLPFVPVLAVLAAGLAGPRAGFHRWRAWTAAAVVVFLAAQWAPQLGNYVHHLRLMAGPDGWRHQLSFDELL
jgi:4-amino-4-deoxy-L-arabinose transferase-like glycosyltransferase